MSREVKSINGKYAVYEGVSGSSNPVTPIFDTEEELVNHLVDNGTEWDNPISRKAAEEFVYNCNYVPSMVLVNGQFLKGLQSLEVRVRNESQKETR